jgi:DNA-binding transcriptional ArsR family regulator
VSNVFRALADPTRRRVLTLLRSGPLNAGELASHFDVSKATMSAHFSVLREADLVTSSKAGTTVTYYLNLSVLEEALLEFTSLFGIQPTPMQPEEPHENEI